MRLSQTPTRTKSIETNHFISGLSFPFCVFSPFVIFFSFPFVIFFLSLFFSYFFLLFPLHFHFEILSQLIFIRSSGSSLEGPVCLLPSFSYRDFISAAHVYLLLTVCFILERACLLLCSLPEPDVG